MARRGEVIAGLVLGALGAAVCVRAVGLHIGTGTSPGPGFFPFLGGLALTVLAGLLAVRGWRGPGEARGTSGLLWRPGALVGGLLVYTAVLDPAGFPLATAALVAVVLIVLDVRNWLVIAGVSVGLAAASYVVFKVWLGVDLPPGIVAGVG
ncbi:MAG: tripartite tricarboxylate transporter TctB family protein [Candidatus Rokubacteria bacterium]|nr:tripartite tricarboxylate transporter TctB family protein [Candidatus Rokubacteria bacterium]